MLFEITSSIVAGSLAGFSYYQNSGGGRNDHSKIVNIARNCGLQNKEGKEIRIHRKSKKDGYTEFVYQMPQGLSAKEFQDKIDNFQDGLNIKKSIPDISIHDFKLIKWRGNVVEQIKAILAKRQTLSKEVEITFDGMLKFRVYNQKLTDIFPYDETLFKRLKGWQIPVGIDRDGKLIKHDPEKIAHLLIGGATDFGKSNFLKLLITTLIHRKPDDVKLFLIDLKGGTAFNRFRECKQVLEVAKDAEAALDVLTLAQEKMVEIYDYLIEKGFEDVKEAGINERFFIVIDEAADLSEHKECQEILKDIARRARAAGMKLIYATQYPTTETVSSQVKRNCIGRLSFVLDTATASNVVLDQKGAESLPHIQGRAIYKQNVKTHIVQTPYIKNDFIKQTIHPHIHIRPRKENVDSDEKNAHEGKTSGRNTLLIEKTELS